MSSDLNEKIELIEVLANKKNTVLTVFWKLLPQYLLSIGLK